MQYQVSKFIRTSIDEGESVEDLAAELETTPEELTEVMFQGELAKLMLINSNVRLVYHISETYKNRGLSSQDLLLEGMNGLTRAVNKFDPLRGNRFSTYGGWWIKQALARACAEKSRIVKLPVYVHETLVFMYKTVQVLKKELKRHPTDTEIAFAMSLPLKKVQDLKKLQRVNVVSSEAPIDMPGKKSSSVDEVTYEERLVSAMPKYNQKKKEEAVTRTTKRDIGMLMYELSEREREIIEMRYGIGSPRKYTLEEIGTKLSLTRERVRQIERMGIDKLRKSGVGDLFDSYFTQKQGTSEEGNRTPIYAETNVVRSM